MASDISFGQFVKIRRKALDLTQEDLALQVGYSVITIRKIEADQRRPSRQLAERLATSLGIVPEEQPTFVVMARSDPGDVQAQLMHRVGTDQPWRKELRAPTNLTSPLTRLIGRHNEVQSVRAILLDKAMRLITLVGPPGIGKTRLSIEVAKSVRHTFPDGVFFVPLASINDPLLIPTTIANAIDLLRSDRQSPVPNLIDSLHDRRVLLVLDNFEHMLEAAPLIADMLTACPGLKALVTSRAPLHLRGERLFQVQPLDLPDASGSLTADEALRSPAVELFLERAQEVNAGFTLCDENAADVAAICAGLDGLPLAIELVAARSRLIAPQDLVARLGARLELLTDGPRDLPARQQTVRNMIDWSYALLDPGEQLLFARLALFIGGCTAQAAEEVANAAGDLPMPVLDGLAALADKNLLGHEIRVDGERYFFFLQTIREYALERLSESGKEPWIRELYDGYYLRLAETANKHLGSNQDQQLWLDRLEAAQANLRAVLDGHLLRQAADPGLRLCAALWKFWHIRSHQSEGRRWISLTLQLDGPRGDRVRAEALQGGGWLALDRRDYEAACGLFTDSLTSFRALNDASGIAEALHGVGIVAQAADKIADAAAAFHESLDLYKDLGDDEGIAWSLDHLGDAALSRRDYEEAQGLFEESLAIFERLRHPWGSAICLHHLGLTALAREDYTRARDRFTESLALFQGLTNRWGIATSFYFLGYTELAMRDHRDAARHFSENLVLSHEMKDRDAVARSLAGLASLAVAERRYERAARLFGAAEAAGDVRGIRSSVIYERDVAVLRAELDEDLVGIAWSAGREMTMNQIMTLTLAGGQAGGEL